MDTGRGGRRESLTLTEFDIVAKVIFSAKLMSSSKIYVSNRSSGSALEHREFSFHCPTPRVPNPKLQRPLYQRIGGDLQELGESQLQTLETMLCTIYMKKDFDPSLSKPMKGACTWMTSCSTALRARILGPDGSNALLMEAQVNVRRGEI